jgi:sulfate permease, SulP family
MTTDGQPAVHRAAGVTVPALRWLRTYRRAWLRPDAVAGVTLAAYLLPAGIADASLANLPPEAGLYAVMLSGLVFWLFCSSTRTAITVTSAISLLVGASLGGVAGGDATRFRALAALAAVMVAAITFVAWLCNTGSVVSFISESVMVGFKCGVALFLASTQLPKLFGFKGAHGGFWERSWHFLTHLPETNRPSLVLGVTALAVLLLGKMFFKTRPVALLVMAAGIIATSAFSLDARGVKLLGDIPGGLPRLSLPPLVWSDVNELLPLALACFLLGAVETAAVGRMFAARYGDRLDSNQELLALSAANLAAGVGQGFPVSGGMSQSLVNESGGAKTPFSGLIAALIVLVVTVFFSGAFRNLPQPVLAAVVLAAVTGLFNVRALKELWKADRAEFVTAMAALLGVLGSGLLRGVLIGAVISLAQLLRRASRPHVALLGRIPGTRRFSDQQRHPDNELIRGVSVFRPESSLLYFNFDHVRETVLSAIRAGAERPSLVIFDLSATPHVDVQSAHGLASLAQELKSEGVRVQAVEARSQVRDRLRRAGADVALGGINRFSSIADVIQANG